ncbi:MAG TPA: FeoA family protein [Deltaproteobacteria bacterium]|nr:FeoA family protein [Deltaproteobacteria bacterium]HQI82321.1 FeoA family protein [Deltaproteobacteria bacterium]
MNPPRRSDLPSIKQKGASPDPKGQVSLASARTPDSSVTPPRKKPRTLLDMKEGETAVILCITGGQGLRARMAGLGIREGRMFRLIRTAPFRGPLLVEDVSTGARIMIGRGMAASVEVCDQTSS